MKEVLWCFTYVKEKTLGENYKEAYRLWRDRNPMMRLNTDAKALLNQKIYVFFEQSLNLYQSISN